MGVITRELPSNYMMGTEKIAEASEAPGSVDTGHIHLKKHNTK